jgi:hypothetical protein
MAVSVGFTKLRFDGTAVITEKNNFRSELSSL